MTRLSGNIVAGVTALLVGASAASAMTVTVDDFTDDQFVQDLPDTLVNASVIPGGMIGGTRYLEVENADSVQAGTQLNSTSGNISFNNAAGTSGIGYIVYDGTTDRGLATNTDIGVGINTTGLGGLDVVAGPSIAETFFSFDLSDFNPGSGGSTALFSAVAYDMFGNVGQFDEIVGAADISPALPLLAFTGSVDWTNLGALAFIIDSRSGTDSVLGEFGGINFDGKVGSITINQVPLPASVLMLLSGVGAIGGGGFLRRKKSHA